MAPETSLYGKRVLLTRSSADVPRLRARLEAMGAIVVDIPTISIEPPRDAKPLDAALQRLQEYDWIAFTSRNAVRAIFDRLDALSPLPSLPPKLRVAAVGPATAELLATRGVAVDCTPETSRGEELARAMARIGVHGTRVLLPVGDLARPDLRLGLQKAGASVDEVIAYRTVRPAGDTSVLDALRRGETDVIALASPSAIRNLAAMLDEDLACLHEARLACIGPTTASAARELGLEPAAVAREHTMDGLVGAIVESCTMENANESV